MAVGEFFNSHPQANWLTGLCTNIDVAGNEIRQRIRLYKNFWLRWNKFSILQVLNYISQPSTFWKKSAMNRIGYFNEQLHYTMDYDYWLRLGQHYPLYVLYRDLSKFRIHSNSKSGATNYRQFVEELQVVEHYYKGLPVFLHRIHRVIAIEYSGKNLNDLLHKNCWLPALFFRLLTTFMLSHSGQWKMTTLLIICLLYHHLFQPITPISTFTISNAHTRLWTIKRRHRQTGHACPVCL